MIVVVELETSHPPGSCPFSRSSYAQAQMAMAKKIRAQRSITAAIQEEGKSALNSRKEREWKEMRGDATTHREGRA